MVNNVSTELCLSAIATYLSVLGELMTTRSLSEDNVSEKKRKNKNPRKKELLAM